MLSQYFLSRVLVRTLSLAMMIGVVLPLHAAKAVPVFQDPLDTPARMRSDPSMRPLAAVVQAGKQLVAVGPRGLIVRSNDDGQHWTQSASPVQSDLLAVHFPDANHGWVVGHDGVILSTADGGQTWVKQLDGRQAKESFERYYANQSPSPEIESAQVTLSANFRSGPALPWLDVWFDDVRTGYVVGSFGMVAVTHDGGQSWQPLVHRIDNPDALNLNAIRRVDGELFIAGERGRIFHFDRSLEHFASVDTGYLGSFFGVIGKGNELLAFGLRGVVYRSADGGTSWQQQALMGDQTFTAGVSEDGHYVLGNLSGQLMVGAWSGSSPHVETLDQSVRLTGMTTTLNGRLVLTSLEGVRVLPLTSSRNRARGLTEN